MGTGKPGIYHVTSAGPIVSWLEFAYEAAAMMELSSDLIEITSYEQLGLPAPRHNIAPCIVFYQHS